MSEYPRTNDKGETVWACCESSIGPKCWHRMGQDERDAEQARLDAKREWVLWGFHPRYAGGEPIKIMGGTIGQCRTEMAFRVEREGGWTCAIYGAGTAPLGLRDMARAAQ